MIALRPIEPIEFPTFAAYFIPEYAAEITANFGTDPAIALAEATASLAQDLPQGADTPGEQMMCITLADQVIGYLFYSMNPDTRSAFIGDFHVLPAHQNQGIGTAAIAALEARLKPEGITQIRLRVAASNTRAQHLYTRLGFFPTGINMAKTL